MPGLIDGTGIEPVAKTGAAAMNLTLEEAMNLTLEVVLPVGDVDHARAFYKALGWRLGADVLGDGDLRVVQLTHLGSACPVTFGAEFRSAHRCSVQGSKLVGDGTEAASAGLARGGVQEVSNCLRLGDFSGQL